MPGEEGALAEKAKKGDHGAFADLVEMHHQRIYALCCSLVGDHHAAQDTAQETFLRAMKGIGGLKDPAKFGKWLVGIAYKVSLSHHRKEKRSATFFHPGYPDNVAFLVKEGPDDAFRDRVIKASNSLEDEARSLLALKYLEGLSYAEIGEIMGIEPKTVKSRLFTARQQLRNKLGNYRPKG
ncbi:MAG: RNA polymerase sigma factor [Planctomycetota bacterium]|jgi:RNA polymerase sigma-70 factor (ECF subfamily)